MKKKFYVLSLAVVLTLSLAAFISGFAGRTTAAPSHNALDALPASDIVITLDTQRLLGEALPSIFADNPTLLAKVNTKIEQFNKEMGIDVRTVDSVAVGMRLRSQSTNDFDTVVISRGHFNANEVIDAAFASAKAKAKNDFQKTEEQYEGKTIFVLVPQRRTKYALSSTTVVTNSNGGDVSVAVAAAPDAKTNSSQARIATDDKGTGPQSSGVEAKRSADQMAVVALDANTIAAGDLKSVKAAIDASMGRERVDDELVRLATQNSSALVGFSGKVPQSVRDKMLAGKGGPETKYIASIRMFYGSFSTNGTEAETLITARTENATQATDMSQALNALKLLGSFGAAQSGQGGERQAMADVLKGLSITAQDNEVQIKMNVNQKALSMFIHGI